MKSGFVLALTALIGACILVFVFAQGGEVQAQDNTNTPSVEAQAVEAVDTKPVGLATAIFAGGCFWCVESDFDKVDGVVETISGYTGGVTSNPTYKQVTYKDTGHYEAVAVRYDPNTVSYGALVEYFFRHIDPTDVGGQFCDRGDSYRPAVFARDGEQTQIVQGIIADLSNELSGEIRAPILPVSEFWPAEDYHQDYYLKNPVRYKYYRYRCGRDARVAKVWGKK